LAVAVAKVAVAAEGKQYLHDNPPSAVDWNLEDNPDYTGINIEWIYFKRDVLDKYRQHPYCDIGIDDRTGRGYEYIRFLSYDSSKSPDSAVRFFSSLGNIIRNMNKKSNFANVPDDPNILMVKARDYVNIPPRERPHWNQHMIPKDKLKLKLNL